MSFTIQALTRQHNRQQFDCGQEDLNEFLRRYALQQQTRLQSRTFVAVNEDDGVTGFYCLNIMSLAFADAPEELVKRLGRYPLSAILIGRFAVDKDYQGQGLGRYLLSHALNNIGKVAELAGVVLALVDPKDDKAAQFYQRLGFRPLLGSAPRMFIPVAELLKA